MIRFFLLFSFMIIQGCSAGYIKGDLSGYDYKKNRVNYCRHEDINKFQIYITTEAVDDYADHFSGFVSIYTLGLVPSYMPSFDKTEIKVIKSGQEIYQDIYHSTAHKFYGWLWLLLPETQNSVSIDESAGMRIRSSVMGKTALKAIEQLSANYGYDINIENACLIDVARP